MQYRYNQSKSLGFNKLDCHWLTWEQSESVVKSVFKGIGERLRQDRYPKTLEIVCGVGKHSKGNQVLGSKLNKFLDEAGMSYTGEETGSREIDIYVNRSNALLTQL